VRVEELRARVRGHLCERSCGLHVDAWDEPIQTVSNDHGQVRHNTREAGMYISQQGLQAVHQEIVNDGLRRSKEQRLRKVLRDRQQAGIEPGARKPRPTLTGMIRCMCGMMLRPYARRG
jgi:hypothetical protein